MAISDSFIGKLSRKMDSWLEAIISGALSDGGGAVAHPIINEVSRGGTVMSAYFISKRSASDCY